jgi:hypothetical protein
MFANTDGQAIRTPEVTGPKNEQAASDVASPIGSPTIMPASGQWRAGRESGSLIMKDDLITALPLDKRDREEFIEAANEVFETVFDRVEPEYPEATRKLWNAEHYIDNVLLTKDMLPVSRDYALSLIDAFLVHHVIGLAVQADEESVRR